MGRLACQRHSLQRRQIGPGVVLPEPSQRDGLPAETNRQLPRFAEDAAGPTVIHDADGDQVLSRFEDAEGQRVIPRRVVSARRFVSADATPIDPSDVHVVDRSQAERSARAGKFRRHLDALTEPDDAVITGQPRVLEMDGQLHRLPGAVVETGLRPGVVFRTRVRGGDSLGPGKLFTGSAAGNDASLPRGAGFVGPRKTDTNRQRRD